MKDNIIYTYTDEAPALATAAFLPVVRAYLNTADINVEIRDLSLAGRLLAAFPEYLSVEQKVTDDLAVLGELVNLPEANIIKLPNISASIPQLQNALRELQAKGYNLPDYPEKPQNDAENKIKERYDLVKGSAVNPVLREGNSDRRVPSAVKKYAKNNPHSMGEWTPGSKTHAVSMTEGDFYNTEKSVVCSENGAVKIEFSSDEGEKILFRDYLDVLEGEILDSSAMSSRKLRDFLKVQIADAKKQDVLFSLQLKASMMKISDPIIFGQMVSVFFEDVFTKYSAVFDKLGINPDNGLAELFTKLENLPAAEQQPILAGIDACIKGQAELAMVNSDKGITSLHVPSDTLIDAAIPAAIRNSGKMWNAAGQAKDVKLVIPDSSYMKVYQNTIDFCKTNGAFDPRTMGSVSNIGLMAKKAEEYGSHDKTFKIPGEGVVRVIDRKGTVLTEHKVQKDDIFRMCQTKDVAVRDWVRVAVKRAGITGSTTIFWLDENRPHDIALIAKVKKYLLAEDTDNLDIRILSPADATLVSLEKMKAGEDSISVTGNVLRDYLTDLFPILELGTSAKMLSIVQLLNGGVLIETGASGSAPKHVQQFMEEGHLRWDSLGEYLGLAVSLETYGQFHKNPKALVLANALDSAIAAYLDENRAPSRKVSKIDNRGSHFYLVLYWAKSLAEQSEDQEIRNRFSAFYNGLVEQKDNILKELLAAQGRPVDLKGYYRPDSDAVDNEMRPSKVFNELLKKLDN